jgi:hypothetical protein
MRRVVLFKRKAEADPQQFQAALANLQTLDQRMPGLDSWWLEINAGRDGLWDAALVADFPDEAALRAYEQHPMHVEAGGAVAAVSEFAVFDE